MESTESLRAAVIIQSVDLLLNKESITYGKTRHLRTTNKQRPKREAKTIK